MTGLVRAVFRLLSMVALSVAVIMAVLDATRSIAAEAVVLTQLGVSWASVSPATLGGFKDAVSGTLPGFVWDSLIAPVLAWPGFAVFFGLALVFHLVGRRPARAHGRFVLDT